MEKKQKSVTTNSNEDIYTTTGKKVAHFFIGFLGITFLISIIVGLLSSLIAQIFNLDDLAIIWYMLSFTLILFITTPIYFFKKNYRYIAIGILSSLIIPLIFAGACFIMFAGAGW